MEQKVSVVLITLNEESIIENCLNKLAFADEIIVVDSGSTDNTVALCEKYGAQVYYNKFEGYGSQKQFAVAKARNNWILSLDADEILSSELIKEIPQTLSKQNADVAAYFIKRQHVFLDRKFKYGNESNRYFLRLFDKSRGNFNANVVHESVIVSGKKEKLKSNFVHFSYKSIEDYFYKFNKYTSLHATSKAGKKSYSFGMILLKTNFDFFKKYLIDRNILNGKEGFYWSYYSSLYTMTKCLKINEANGFRTK
ncbi:glycosyltransferase family 2 protein [Flavobacterium algicola]|uniref:glycosyltransferase family 2 protein n=1 Tax=Flavobacterium algicola TaxID=556529 RepID=UPI001EFD74AE|nr:glycosyltransferase family 2 protein [Flavobacterium algicola]MCG9791096.1 glycosyltransferase family 2 protein [Flavobacterium algicola]